MRQRQRAIWELNLIEAKVELSQVAKLQRGDTTNTVLYTMRPIMRFKPILHQLFVAHVRTYSRLRSRSGVANTFSFNRSRISIVNAFHSFCNSMRAA